MGGKGESATKDERTAWEHRAIAWLKGVWRQVRDHVSENWRSLALAVAAWAAAAGLVSVSERLGLTPQLTVIFAGVLAAFALLQLGKFLPADWFLAFLLCLTVAFYFGAIAYQADVRDETGRGEKTITVAGGAHEWTTLQISYPRTIPLEPADKPGWPMSAYFQPPVAETLGPAINRPAYVVSLIPVQQDVIDFTDEGGVPLPARITVSPGGQAEPSALYLRQNTTFARSFPVTATVGITVHHSSGQPAALWESPSGSPTLEFALEDTRAAWRRHFLALVLAPTTPFIAVAGSVVALAVWWWQEEQRRRRDQQKAISAIRHVRQLAEKSMAAKDPQQRLGCLQQAERELDEVRKKCEAVPELQKELGLATEAMRRAQLEQIRRTVAENWARAQNQYEELRAKKEVEGWKDEGLEALLWEVGAIIEGLTPRPGPPEIPAVAAWLQQKGLQFNPFGPEKAEEDVYFLQRCVEPPAWDAIRRCAPAIIEDAPGSGRTAARLYLTHYCKEHSLASAAGEPDTLVISMEWPLEGPASDAPTACRKALAAAIAEANLKQLAQQPDRVDRTPFHQQQGLAVLFRVTRDIIGNPGVYLERHGLERERAQEIAGLFKKMSMHLAMPRYDSEPDIVHLLEKARLAPYAQYFVCVEIPDDAAAGQPNAEVQAHLQALGTMMTSFAESAVFLKVFIQQDWAHLLQAPDTMPRAKLDWDKRRLTELLRQRLAAAGAAEDIRSLFSSVKGDLEGLLLDVALKSAGPPRELIRLGNALVLEDATDPPLTWEKAEGLLKAQGEDTNG